MINYYMRNYIDINCDMGEGYPNDEEIMPFISSANIACGGHTGDENTIRKTIQLCIKHNVAAGAHPSFPDKENFGRINISINDEELLKSIQEQVLLFNQVVKECGITMHHIKLHGALYNYAANNRELAEKILETFKMFKTDVCLYGLSGSVYNHLARDKGFHVIDEVFADRTYQLDGSLTPRSSIGALIENDQQVLSQVLRFINEEKAVTLTGEEIPVKSGTVCIHGDGPRAAAFASMIHRELTMRNIRIKAPE